MRRLDAISACECADSTPFRPANAPTRRHFGLQTRRLGVTGWLPSRGTDQGRPLAHGQLPDRTKHVQVGGLQGRRRIEGALGLTALRLATHRLEELADRDPAHPGTRPLVLLTLSQCRSSSTNASWVMSWACWVSWQISRIVRRTAAYSAANRLSTVPIGGTPHRPSCSSAWRQATRPLPPRPRGTFPRPSGSGRTPTGSRSARRCAGIGRPARRSRRTGRSP